VLIYIFPIGCLYCKNGEGTPKDENKALQYFVLAADQGHMQAIHRAINIYLKRYKVEGLQLLYNVMYYCRKYIKLSETKEYNKAVREEVTRTLSSLSSI
jgi:TPR repeat protein